MKNITYFTDWRMSTLIFYPILLITSNQILPYGFAEQKNIAQVMTTYESLMLKRCRLLSEGNMTKDPLVKLRAVSSQKDVWCSRSAQSWQNSSAESGSAPAHTSHRNPPRMRPAQYPGRLHTPAGQPNVYFSRRMSNWHWSPETK